jgi:hypothetical protein
MEIIINDHTKYFVSILEKIYIMRVFLLIVLLLLLKTEAKSQNDSILYHDRQMESQWGSSTTNDDFGCFVRFTPSSYPAWLTGVKAFFRNAGSNSTFKWKIYSDPFGMSNGGINSVYISQSPIVNPAAGGISNQQYSIFTDLTSDSISITSGDFYVGVVQTTDFFGIGIDNAPDDSVAIDRQWQWMTVFGQNYWNTLASQASAGQFGITAFINSFQTQVDKTSETAIRIFYSNPDNLLYVDCGENVMEVLITVSDISGRTIFSEKNNIQQAYVNLTDFESGIYLVSVIAKDKIFSKKIFKHH